MGSKLDIAGQTFGYLTAIEPTDKRYRSMIVWKFQCQCGNIVEKPAAMVKSGNIKSCGCMKNIGLKKYNEEHKIDIVIGTRFGKLEVIKDLGFQPYGNTGKNRSKFLCKCDCGNFCESWGNVLLTGHKISCGCVCSKGEEKIKNLLNKNKIKYLHDVCFKELTEECGRKLRFDFIIYDENNEVLRFVEFDGRQHYTGPDTKLWNKSSETLEDIKEKDQIKNNFCKKHNYTLVRIPFYRLDKLDINDILGSQYIVKEEEMI